MVAHARVPLLIVLLKNLFFCMIWGSNVPNLMKIGELMTSQSCPQMLDGRMDGLTDGRLRDFIFCPVSNAIHCIALDMQ